MRITISNTRYEADKTATEMLAQIRNDFSRELTSQRQACWRVTSAWRVLAENSKVEFIDDKEGNQFTVRISRLLTASEAASGSKQAVSNEQKILDFCVEPRSLAEICEHLGLKDRYKVKKKYINPLLGKTLRMTEPDSPNSPTQKYVRRSSVN